MMQRSRVVFAISLCALLLASPAGARSTLHDLNVKEARDSEKGKEKLLKVPFYMAGQKHGGVAKDFGVFTANRRTNAFGKTDEEACQIAFLSAVIALQSRAQQLGGNAVVDIKSTTKHNDLASASKYRCAAGGVVANVVLTGRVVKLK
jgi:uncharacterized protein YbjQ (UPF0145 family)